MRYRTILAAMTAVMAILSVSCSSKTRPEDCSGPPGSHFLTVYPGGQVSQDCVHVSKGKNNRIAWVSEDGSDLKIEFSATSPFPNLTCSGDSCSSGKIAANAAGDYAYTCKLGTKSADPKVIVDP